MDDIVLADLKYQVEKFGTQKKAAKWLKISPQYLNDILQEKRPVSEHVAHKLGWELVRTWMKKAH